jgi:hypothetical protein
VRAVHRFRSSKKLQLKHHMITDIKPHTKRKTNSASRAVEPSKYLYDPNNGLYAEISTIHPMQAKRLLEGQIKNRKVSKASVKKYAEAMSSFKWVLNGAPIIFANGVLIDGQHRLHACIKSRVPLKTLIIKVTDESVFTTLDTGKKRSNSDVVSVTEPKGAATLVAAVDIVAKIDFDGKLVGNGAGSRLNIPTYEIEGYVKKYAFMETSVEETLAWSRKLKVKKSSLAALHYLLTRAALNPEYVDQFLGEVFGTYTAPIGSPSVVLKDAIVKGLISKTINKTPGWLIRAGILAWNAWRQDKTLQRLKVGNSPIIPTPVS